VIGKEKRCYGGEFLSLIVFSTLASFDEGKMG